MPCQGTANVTRTSSWAMVSAAAQSSTSGTSAWAPRLRRIDDPAPRILEAPDVIDPRACSVDDDPRVDRDLVAVDAHVRPDDAVPRSPQSDDLRAVQHGGSRELCGPHVRETEPCVVRGRVDVQGTRAKALHPQVRDEPPCALWANEPVEA